MLTQQAKLLLHPPEVELNGRTVDHKELTILLKLTIKETLVLERTTQRRQSIDQ
jgi:hypothetical protein